MKKLTTGKRSYFKKKWLPLYITCDCFESWKGCSTFEELAIMFESNTVSGAEQAYCGAVDKLTEFFVAESAIHAFQLKQKSKTKHKKKIAAAIYEYQANCDGEWSEISVDFKKGIAEIIRLADWDTVKINKFANEAPQHILSFLPAILTKHMLFPFEPSLIS